MRDAETIADLQSEISRLEQLIKDRPALLWYRGVYKYAFPEPGKETTFLCAECWDQELIPTELVKTRESAGTLGYCEDTTGVIHNFAMVARRTASISIDPFGVKNGRDSRYLYNPRWNSSFNAIRSQFWAPS